MYIHNMMERFLGRLQKTKICFVLYNVDARDLPQHLEHSRYARIEVSLLADRVDLAKAIEGGQHLRQWLYWDSRYAFSLVPPPAITTTERARDIDYYLYQCSKGSSKDGESEG